MNIKIRMSVLNVKPLHSGKVFCEYTHKIILHLLDTIVKEMFLISSFFPLN